MRRTKQELEVIAYRLMKQLPPGLDFYDFEDALGGLLRDAGITEGERDLLDYQALYTVYND